ncbi:threonine/serine exporter family protein [Lichenifustis flavocetrariae]|uniref:Threonine/serine exporter family protein n=1 Tax=Lichenifustis flavocetrariae TaxID=2949735 RepID=A0AA41Z061_9HYPH|nr:threonine/serine exporter family protein [Lichenifustis flavocetrariae]MCW6511789.1 threonine/serine exporter family protein [Lichenifustis flavocetrariae]
MGGGGQAPALSLLNGAADPQILPVVGVAAFAGGLLRRWMGERLGINNGLAQLFAAALLAGVVGGVATRFHVALDSGLVMMGPLLVLVPGPALMGATFDLAGLRLLIGLARLTYGLLSIVALSAGVLIGAGLADGVAPDPNAPPSDLSWWQDMACAAMASAAYGVFFSIPYRMLALPVIVGALAHGLRWFCLTELHLANASAAGIGCLLVGVVVEPIARRWRLPFAAVGFAAVVAQVPGSFLFRMAAGLVELQRAGAGAPLRLLAGIGADGGTALLTLVAMALGLVIPKSIWMRLDSRRCRAAEHERF